MRVVVRFEESCELALGRWRHGLSANPLDRAALAQVYLDELKKRLVAFGGLPEGALILPGTEPLLHWAELSGGAWVSYTVEDAGRFVRRTRTIRVIELDPHPPRSAVPASPPG